MHFNREALTAAAAPRLTRRLKGAQSAESQRHGRECLRARETEHDELGRDIETDPLREVRQCR